MKNLSCASLRIKAISTKLTDDLSLPEKYIHCSKDCPAAWTQSKNPEGFVRLGHQKVLEPSGH